ncbi:MAG: PQQ-binding-like beta-propeller repeat protein [Bacteroidota bacterium]|nr:PQQ-binding-like beta-propeller repeat protein [Bacteroidota bacterium]MDP4255267.1 PQQ-binding-like beta-propeller repeat protein [Bacteroidota bacterium]
MPQSATSTLVLLSACVMAAGMMPACTPGKSHDVVSSSLSFRANKEHTGDYASEAGGLFDTLVWRIHTGGKIFGSPAISKGRLFVGSEEGRLIAVDLAGGRIAWTFPTGGPIPSSPAVFDDMVFFLSYDGTFYGVDVITGRLKWKFQTGGEKRVGAKGLWTMQPRSEYMDDPFDFFLSSPAIDEAGGIVYFGSGDGNVYALHAGDGRLVWKFQTQGIVHTSPALYRGKLYIGSWDRNLYALDAATGAEKWKFETGRDTAQHLLEGIQSSATASDGKIYFGSRDGYFYALDAETGKMAWKYPANNSWILTTAAVRQDTLYLGTSDTYRMIALNAATGKELYQVQASGYVYSSPSLAGHNAYFGDFTGRLFAADITAAGRVVDSFSTPGRLEHASTVLKNGKIDFALLVPGMDLSYYASTVAGMNRLYTLGPILSSPVISGGVLYFGSGDSCLYAMKLKHPF